EPEPVTWMLSSGSLRNKRRPSTDRGQLFDADSDSTNYSEVEVGEKHSTMTLTCQTNKENIRWRRQDSDETVEITESELQKLNGSTLTLSDLQEDQIGNYSCWSKTGLEDHMYLLLDQDQGEWVSRSVDGVFFVPHLTDLYSEEQEQIVITAEAVSSKFYFKTDYSFFLRDIVKPGNPKISICGVNKEGTDQQLTNVKVTPATTWPQPYSFFPLEHQIEYQNRHDGKLETIQKECSRIRVHGLVRKLRARSRDLLLRSQWSEWTSWINASNNGSKVERNKTRHKKKQPHKKHQKRLKKCQKRHN
ncbi:hypothetical protein DNTS_016534, partial [Danionella cerebrum]